MKDIIRKQYQNKVDTVAQKLLDYQLPPEGWICTVRKALGLTAATLARRMGKTRALISSTEKAELDGRVTLKTMQSIAENMNCRFVYAIVPYEKTETLIKQQARKKARQLVEETSSHMALEEQALSREQLKAEVERLAKEMQETMPVDFWEADDKKD